MSNNGFDSNKGQILLNLIIFALEENKTFDVFQLVSRIFPSFSLNFPQFFVQIETIVEQSEKIFAEIFDFLSSAGRKSHQQTSIDLIKKMVRRKNQKKKKRSFEIRCLDRKTRRSFGEKTVGISIKNLWKTFKIVRWRKNVFSFVEFFSFLLNFSADKNYAGLQPIGKSLVKEVRSKRLKKAFFSPEKCSFSWKSTKFRYSSRNFSNCFVSKRKKTKGKDASRFFSYLTFVWFQCSRPSTTFSFRNGKKLSLKIRWKFVKISFRFHFFANVRRSI